MEYMILVAPRYREPQEDDIERVTAEGWEDVRVGARPQIGKAVARALVTLAIRLDRSLMDVPSPYPR